MKYVIIEPEHERVRSWEGGADTEGALREANLTPGHTDHGVAAPGIGYFVYEYGLLDPIETTHYAGLDNRLLCAGNILLYGFDEAGDSVDLTLDLQKYGGRVLPFNVRFYHGGAEVERGIERGEVLRPVTKFNDEVIWSWPDKQ